MLTILTNHESRLQENYVQQMIENNIVQHNFCVHTNRVTLVPILQGYIWDGHGTAGPLVLIGCLATESVYRTFLKLKHSSDNIFFLRDMAVQ